MTIADRILISWELMLVKIGKGNQVTPKLSCELYHQVLACKNYENTKFHNKMFSLTSLYILSFGYYRVISIIIISTPQGGGGLRFFLFHFSFFFFSHLFFLWASWKGLTCRKAFCFSCRHGWWWWCIGCRNQATVWTYRNSNQISAPELSGKKRRQQRTRATMQSKWCVLIANPSYEYRLKIQITQIRSPKKHFM